MQPGTLGGRAFQKRKGGGDGPPMSLGSANAERQVLEVKLRHAMTCSD